MPIDLISLILVHFLCTEQARVDPMPINEAAYCSSNFERLKISLHPDLTHEEYANLDEKERSKISVEAYRYYKEWRASNPALVAKLEEISAYVTIAQR